MIRINITQGLLSRLKDRGWKNVNLRGYTDQYVQVLRRNYDCIIVVESVNLDPSVDITPQVDGFFRNLIDIIQKTLTKEIFLPGNGDISIPPFFQNWCDEHGIKIHLLSLDDFQEYYNYN